MKNHYQTLGIQSNATNDEIKKSYRELAWRYHPDRNGGDLTLAEKFKDIQEAYGILSNHNQRKNFDIFLKVTLSEHHSIFEEKTCR